MVDLFNSVMRPLEVVVAWIMVAWHTALTAVGLPAASGITWALSIIGLVVVIRIVLIPLFVKQIKASRGMQLIQPEVKKIQEKYKGKTDQASRQAMTQETMALYKESGTNPFASCLPILLQSPIFFALFRVLNGIHKIAIGEQPGFGPLDQVVAAQADTATIFNAPLSSSFLHSDLTSTKILTVVLIILMSLTTFTTQRQLMMKNMPAAALDNPFAQQQKIMLYVLPVVFAVSGVNFPIGVLLYWLTTNVWSMGQQFYVIRRMPAPGSPAEKALQERRKNKGRSVKGLTASLEAPGLPAPSTGPDVRSGNQRQQPKRQPRSKRAPQARTQRRPGTGEPGHSSSGSRGNGLEPDR